MSVDEASTVLITRVGFSIFVATETVEIILEVCLLECGIVHDEPFPPD
jgi:hypothetical protein